MALRSLLFSCTLILASIATAKTVHYELTVADHKVNLSGKKEVDFALAVNGQIPAPPLEFTEGDEAEIVVKNRVVGQEVSTHWHGILLPPEMDGVPYLTTTPIHNGEDHTFRFKIRQNGTYWYHSHTDVQEQKGIFGAIVIHPKKEKIKYDKDVVVMLNDWTDENPTQVLKNLKKDGDYYLYKKGTMRSWIGAIQAKTLGTYLHNEWTRMGGMDYSDIGYDAFLINGKRDSQIISAKRGEKVRLRIINAAASTYFHVALGDQVMKVVSADGIEIEPVSANEILMGLAETFDVAFEIPANKNYELKITAQDGTGTASGWIGNGEKIAAPVKATPAMYEAMDHHHNHSATIPTLTVDELKALEKTDYSGKGRVYDLKLALTGDMRRYVWHINGKAIHQDRTITVSEGDVFRLTFENTTMMHHPFHLHGHFFRVLNKYGEYSPLKHTVDVPPHGSRTIEFLATEPGEWMLHCHNLYHMKSGMARVVKYTNFTPSAEIANHQKHDPHAHDHWYSYGKAEAATNHGQAYFRLSQTWNELSARIETRNTSSDEPLETEGDLFYRRWIDQYFNVILGGTTFARRSSGVIGVGYLLPFLIDANLLIDQQGKWRIDLEKRFQWTKNVFSKIDYTWRPNSGHDSEYEVSLMYSPSWSWAAGLMVTNNAAGAGLEVQF